MTSEELVRIEKKIASLEKEIESIKQRNTTVEENKAWEQSYLRIFFIALLTYLLTAIIFHLISIPNPLLNALIPTTAYVISSLSLFQFKIFFK